MPIRLGIDVGGTFTDLFLLNADQETTHLVKTPSTPNNHIVGILKGLQELLTEVGISAVDIDAIVHGTSYQPMLCSRGKEVELACWLLRISSKYCTSHALKHLAL